MDQLLTPHFRRSELESHGAFPDEDIPVVTALLTHILEPVRAQYAAPVICTSGFRDTQENHNAHGVSNSQHIYTPRQCAIDFFIMLYARNMRPVFDWIRTNGMLYWDQLILEHDPANGTDVIHVSYVLGKSGRRMALEGEVTASSQILADVRAQLSRALDYLDNFSETLADSVPRPRDAAHFNAG